MENKAHHEPSKLSYQLLKQITNDFDEKRRLGSGGFGTVYKGVYENGGEIAVKVLHTTEGLDDKEFIKEFHNLRGLEHQNIAELIGFCNEWEKELVVIDGKQVNAERLRMALCFEYAHNGSLHKHISDEKRGLTWHTRYRIIKGICEGLKYLREELEYPVMHFDLKPHNIVLDKSMAPKITDFGSSMLFGLENTRKILSVAGTIGYCPPEYIKHQIISREFDIFSLGVIIIRIMTGHESYISVVEMPTRKSVKFVHESWRKRLHGTLSHASLEVYCNQVKTCIEIALHCLNSNRQDRPTIQHIVDSLNMTEAMIGDRGIQDEQFYQEESTLPSNMSNITINSGPSSENFLAVEPKIMPFGLLKAMTNDFSNERLIGRGGHTNVYKGVHGDGQVIAVKKFHDIAGIYNKLFMKNEIAILMQLRHKNIVQFIGYCNETEEMVVDYNGKHVIAERMHLIMCFEYLEPLDRYISQDMDSGLNWQTRYRIIKGMCEGLRYLHEGLECPVLHLGLEPSNIFLDTEMMPKIGGFNSPRLLDDQRNISVATMGTLGYMPPEYIEKQVISKEFDIFSLGVIILKLVAGKESYWKFYDMSPQKFVALEHEKWRERLQKTLDGTSVEGYCQQVEKCLEIAVKCVEDDRKKRPAMGEIIQMLNETEILTPQLEIGPDSEQLLEVHPLQLQFMSSSSSLELPRKRTAAMMPSSCLLQLDNKGNDRVAFKFVANNPRRYLTKTPLFGVVPPRSVYTLALTLMPSEQPSSTDSSVDFFTLYSVAVGAYDLQDIDKDSRFTKYNNFFQKAKETAAGGEMQETKLNVICDTPADQGPSTRSTLEINIAPDAQQVSSIDVHPIEPWIMTTTHLGSLGVWNYHTMATVTSFQFTNGLVHAAKFIAREKWIAAGDRNGCVHVYSYHKHEDVKRWYAHDSCITTLAVHPTHPFLLSSSEDEDHLIKLWDWGNGWKCTREFSGHTKRVTKVMFNPEDEDSFASASLDGTVKVWRIRSDEPNNIITLKLEQTESLVCVDYFTRLNRQHFIVGCKERTAQIWELGMQTRVDTLEGHADHISVANFHPELSVLVTGSLDGTVRIWNSTTYKIENIICVNLGAIYALGWIKGSSRIMVGCHQGMATMEFSSPSRERW